MLGSTSILTSSLLCVVIWYRFNTLSTLYRLLLINIFFVKTFQSLFSVRVPLSQRTVVLIWRQMSSIFDYRYRIVRYRSHIKIACTDTINTNFYLGTYNNTYRYERTNLRTYRTTILWEWRIISTNNMAYTQ